MDIVNIQNVQVSAHQELGLTPHNLLNMLERMLEIRLFEEKVEALFLVQGRLIGPSHLYLGQEAVAVGVTAALRPDDLLVTTYRCHGHALAKNVPPRQLMAELFGKETGTCKGLGGSMHASIYTPTGSVFATAIVGSGIPVAAGVALALKEEGSSRVAVVFFGDGAVNTGAFHEGVNIAAAWRVPLILVCENNLYAMSTRIHATLSSSSIAERGASYGIVCLIVDGNNPLAVCKASKIAAERARLGEGPTMVECRTYKMKGHGVYDKGEYRPEAEVKLWGERDPVNLFTSELVKEGIVTAEDVERMRQRLNAEIEDAVDFSTQSQVLPFRELPKHVYA